MRLMLGDYKERLRRWELWGVLGGVRGETDLLNQH